MMYYFDRDILREFKEGDGRCFCMPNGLGGYCCHSVINSSHRKHYGYLVASLKSPVLRMLLLTRINESIQIGNNLHDLEAQEYVSVRKEGNKYLDEFYFNYIPTFHYSVEGVTIKKRMSPMYKSNTVAITYEILSRVDATLYLEPLFNYREHGFASTCDDLKFSESNKSGVITLIPDKNPDIKIKFAYSVGVAIPNDDKITEGLCYGYDMENGDSSVDHHYKPYKIKVELKANEVKLVGCVCTIDRLPKTDAFGLIIDYEARLDRIIRQAKLKDSLATDLVVSADIFICDRASTGLKTILAGLPWFTDWGRDTMLSFTGLTLVTRRFKEAKEILKSFSMYEKDGLIPNMFPDDDSEPIYNTVDASLWYFYAVYKYVNYTGDYEFIKTDIYPVLKNIIKAYSKSTKFGIKMDSDYLISAGSIDTPLTWMDVKVDKVGVTPRNGKAVEINALWYNALMIMSILANAFGDDYEYYNFMASKVYKSFNEKFYCEETGCLYDVVEPNDNSVRPNQIWVVSLPFKLLSKEKATNVFKVVEKELYNKLGLRSLSPKNPQFKPKYEGGLIDRDMAYHMGTTWSFLIGAYLDSYHYVYSDNENVIDDINDLVHVFREHLSEGCINGVAEIFDGDIASRTRGCFTQAWSVGELLRAYFENVLMEK